MKVTLLGSGTSGGVPEIGCSCEVCKSADPRDNRLRAGVLVEANGLRILLDCGPDFRQQILPFPFEPIDAVLVSHEHYDHVGGLDDLRPFCSFSVINIYGLKRSMEAIQDRMPYCFGNINQPRVPHIQPHDIEPYQPFIIKKSLLSSTLSPSLSGEVGEGLSILPFTVYHGTWPILGYRMGNFAFITDMKSMPEESYACLQNLDLLFINGLRFKEHPTHQTVNEAVRVAEKLKAKEVRIIHLAHSAGLHGRSREFLPPHVAYGYDGEQFEL